MKLDIADVIGVVKDALTAKKVDETIIRETLAEIQKGAKEVKAEEKEETGPKPRKGWSVLSFATDDPNILKGYIFNLDEGVESHLLATKVTDAAREYNESKKGKKRPVKNLSETVEVVANKYFKNVGLSRKNKEAILFGKYEDKF